MYPAIDSDLLVKLVKERPVLWDKNTKGYRSGHTTRTAWHEIFCKMYNGYGLMAEEHKEKYGSSVKKKWMKIRDAFQRDLRKRRLETGKSEPPQGTKESARFEPLKFLLKVHDMKVDHTQADASYNWPSISGVHYVDPEAEAVINFNHKGSSSNKQQQESFKMRSKISEKKQNCTPYSNFETKPTQPVLNKVRVINVGGDSNGRSDFKSESTLQYIKNKIKNCNDQDGPPIWTESTPLMNMEPEQIMTVNEEPLHISSSVEVKEENHTPVSGYVGDSAYMTDTLLNVKLKEEDQTPTSSYQIEAEETFNPTIIELEDSSDSKYTASQRQSSLVDDNMEEEERKLFFQYLLSNTKSLNDATFLDFKIGVLQLLKQLKFPK